MINRFLRILFPEICPVCKKPSTDHVTAPICADCWQAISSYEGPACQKCGKPLVSDVSIICGECLEDEPAFEWVRSFGLYDGALKEAISLFKYYGIRRLSRPLSEMMLKIRIPHTDAVIPVPLTRKKLRQREFNQAALFAKHIANHIGAKIILNCLIKIRDTAPQVGLNAEERRKNIKNAFGIVDKEVIQGKSVILVDDVFTTGATIRNCAKLLKKAGAGEVYAVTLAHSMRD